MTTFDFQKEFPLCERDIIYFDSAATALKHRSVIEAINEYYTFGTANVHRGAHQLGEWATDRYEGARETARRFINAPKIEQVIFNSGTTAGINFVAQSYGEKFVGEGDEILVSRMEHHANIVPWQLLAKRTGCVLKVVDVTDEGELDLETLDINERTKLVAVSVLSNVLGTINPIETIIAKAHARGVPVLLDAAQAMVHKQIDVQKLDCDFLVFSSHKVFGPTGVGVLYMKEKYLDQLDPVWGGGDMIRSVSFEGTTFADPPSKFEAGTPNIAGVIGLGAALKFVESIGFAQIEKSEKELLDYGTDALSQVDGLRIIGTSKNKVAIFSFLLDDIHPHDIGTILDQQGIAIRTGHHCAQPLMDRYGISATARASLSVYNSKDQIDKLVDALQKAKELFN